MPAGLSARSDAGAATYSAYVLPSKLGKRRRPKTSSPTEKPSTSAATASTTPDRSVPGITGKVNFGLVSGGRLDIPSRRYQSGGDADCVHADEHLTRPRLGNRHLVVTQNFRAAVLMEPDRPHVCVGIVFSCPRCGIGLSGSAIHINGPLI
jgi:hypothetical protein